MDQWSAKAIKLWPKLKKFKHNAASQLSKALKMKMKFSPSKTLGLLDSDAFLTIPKTQKSSKVFKIDFSKYI